MTDADTIAAALAGDSGDLLAMLADLPADALESVISTLPLEVVQSLQQGLVSPILADLGGDHLPATPLDQALELDATYVARDHLRYLSDRIAAAIADVERGVSRKLVVSMPPRFGKSRMTSIYTPVWLLRKHPDWKLMLASHSPDLAASWGREVRRIIERNPSLGVAIAPDAKAVTRWETTSGGIMRSLSVGQSPTGEGAKVLFIDDPIKSIAAAHSESVRDAQWEWWTADMSTRLEGATLVVVTMTRWHEDDLVGRLLSPDHPGDPSDWEQIVLPAIATKHDVIGRAPGEPLLSPLSPGETPAQALERFAKQKASMGSYQWAALYDQQPAPATGAIFSSDWWRYWTTDPDRATADGKVVYIDPDNIPGATVIDSWDMAFKATKTSDYVVGQRWASVGADRFLLAQKRDRLAFTPTRKAMKAWVTSGPSFDHVRRRLVEDKANGPAIIESLRSKIGGIKPITPRGSKEARARAHSAIIESGNVYLPHPDDPGNGWVREFIEEARVFPNGRHDDQVDAMTQALDDLHTAGAVRMHKPAAPPRPIAAGGSRRPPSFLSGARRR